MTWLELLTDHSARRWLRRMGAQLDSGWIALAGRESLRQAFGEHLDAVAEVVRCEEQLVPRPEPVTALVLLASHAYDTRLLATRAGWRPPRTVIDWSPREWYGLRLLACYRLACGLPHGPRLPGAARPVTPRLGHERTG
ncbi:DUF6401 family natural product biosynthesis protein [Amycolatopsis cihanbeyliensis]|uniref:Uncharacterized protein n=1 Tax=Amycolatopsis cihanbeyliensis TaxID=1128664 RepID=A0A542DK70_AMYCI|nr:DUF6401 family natural product biosynthesis protein [Amycolatopsis cihanbeyliensis]TQJ03414.1 hypothetical protein FB471_3170 [Amycolatopsis cihanbeyliensis]